MKNKKRIKAKSPDIKNLEEKIENLEEKIDRIEKLLKGFSNYLNPDESKVIYLDKVFRHPIEYNFNFTKKSLANLVKEKLGSTEINQLHELGLSQVEIEDLQSDLYIPDAKTSEKLKEMLGVPWSDFILSKAKTYEIMKDSPEEHIKPYLELDTFTLLEKLISEKLHKKIICFVMNLFVKNKTTDLLTAEPTDYEIKTREEIEKIEKIQEEILLLEYPTDTFAGEKKLHFKITPEQMLDCITSYTSSVFVKLQIEEKPKFYKIQYTEWISEKEGKDSNIVLRDLAQKKVFLLHLSEFQKLWEKANFELIAFYDSSYKLKNIIEEITYIMKEVDMELKYLTDQTIDWMYEEVYEREIYMIFKNKWIIEMCYPDGRREKILSYVIEPSGY